MSDKIKCTCTIKDKEWQDNVCYMCDGYLDEYDVFFTTQQLKRNLCKDCHENEDNYDCKFDGDPMIELEKRIDAIEGYIADVKKILHYSRLRLND